MEKVTGILTNIIYVFGLILLAILLFTVTVFRVNINFGIEGVNINYNNLTFYVLLILGIIICLAAGTKGRGITEKISEKTLFTILAIAFTVAGLYIIFNTTMSLRNDQVYCFSGAKDFNRGDYRALYTENYLGYYSHQLGLVTYERILCFFSENIMFFQLVNLMLEILNNYITYRITDLLFDHNTLINKYAIVLSFLFLPQFFFIMYVYGNIPGFTCLMVSYYFGLKFLLRRGRLPWLNLALWVLFSILTSLIRLNCMIGVIAFVIVAALEFLSRKQFGYAAFVILAVIFTFTVPSKVLKEYYEWESGIEVSRGTPRILHTAMGMQEGYAGNGWYNGYNNNTYEDSGFDYEASVKEGEEEIKRRLAVFAADPAYAIDFYSGKFISTWADPTYQSINSAPAITLENWDDKVRGELLNSIYSGGAAYSKIATICNVVNVIIVAGAFIFYVFRFRSGKKSGLRTVLLLFMLYTIGGMLFHELIWETKARYVPTYIYILVPAAAAGLTNCADYICLKTRK